MKYPSIPNGGLVAPEKHSECPVTQFRKDKINGQKEFEFEPIRLESSIRYKNEDITTFDDSLSLDPDCLYLAELVERFRVDQDFQRFHYGKWYTAFSMVIANLVEAYFQDKFILLNRSTSSGKTKLEKFENRIIISVCDWLESFGYAQTIIQPPQCSENNCSSVIRTNVKLVEIFVQSETISVGEVIELRDDCGDLVIVNPEDIPLFNDHREVIDNSNVMMEKVYVSLGTKQLNTRVARIFNRDFELGGRSYAGYQNLTKQQRKLITINGESTVEPDFNQLHPHLLYALCGLQLTEDPYLISGFSRDTVKKIFLIFINCKGQRGLDILAKQITLSARRKQKQEYSRYQHKRAMYEIKREKCLLCSVPYKAKNLNQHIEGIPDGTDGKKLVEALTEKHQVIMSLVNSENIGLKLQYQDSQIMKEVMRELTTRNIPHLVIHDSVRCQKSSKQVVHNVMKKAYLKATGFTITVSCN